MDVNKILESVLGSQLPGQTGGSGDGGQPGGRGGGLAGSLLGGAAAGGLMGMLTGSKKKGGLGGKVITYGGLAVVGGLAYKAYRDWQAKNAAAPAQAQAPAQIPASAPTPIAPAGFDVENDRDAAGDDFRLILVRAMIAAAQSDDHIYQDEHRRIREQVKEWDLGPTEKAALYDYFSDPADAATIARLARTDEQRAEIYLASALSIDPDTPQEQAYLQSLADRLGLPEGLRGYLDAEAEAARLGVD
ncbi:tellurite resistance TerB family protein [Acuticoccus kandeliae]|uniref:tellurite resistance TerB family protein n=1 Tax=Acuticoccus kandeliae TaxID=2073160 RepID=UPI000D3EB524|nr:tellurite resistance TerB family protein [Acuticoccus kandeliae]